MKRDIQGEYVFTYSLPDKASRYSRAGAGEQQPVQKELVTFESMHTNILGRLTPTKTHNFSVFFPTQEGLLVPWFDMMSK